MKVGLPVFVCYRQSDEPGYVAQLCVDLRQQLSVEIIRDKDYFKGGESWSEDIDVAISTSSIVLAVVGRSWQQELEQRDKNNDEVRRELTIARQKKIPVLPVLLNDARLPNAEALGELSWLLRLHHRTLIDGQDRWPADIESLATRIRELTGLAPATPKLRWRSIMLAGILGLLLIVSAFAVLNRNADWREASIDSQDWVLNWNRMAPEYPYDKIRYTSGGGMIVSADGLTRILHSLSLPNDSKLKTMRDTLSQRIEAAEKVNADHHKELVGYEELGLNVDFKQFESDWSDLRAAVRAYARNIGIDVVN